MSSDADSIDVAIVGGGAAGLMAAIQAGRTDPRRRIVVLDGASSLGAKILIAGGGRCNVTHDVVEADAFFGGSQNAIRKVLRRFDAAATVTFFADLGVTLKREDTGKLFPTTDRARTVLDALIGAARDAGVVLRHPWRVETIVHGPDGFTLAGPMGALAARQVILATGGRAVPTTGSDGHGYVLARSLGHSITPHVLPALVPLTLPAGHVVTQLAGVTVPATLTVERATGKRVVAFTDSTLCTHRGLSGPSVLDVSRHWLHARLEDPGARLVLSWLPGETVESIDRMLAALGRTSPGRALHERALPERLARALCIEASVDPGAPGHALTRVQRRALATTVAGMTLPITGDRGFTHAEATAGGVPLTELKLETMASRLTPGLHVIGELCDVDGRIGGYNFQWAWSSGFVAGTAVG
ncbi:MAG TPA: aminoacetone oxidase family FAD-binding enzyme [Candidatus Binatia bacterium]|nr:aminoacetone oxidase family FAD-binding enzyme [Candidatus Binatia bacterium]